MSLFHSINPATGETVWQGEAASAGQVARAVQAARNAFPIWSRTSFDERATRVLAFRDAVAADAEALARAISLETGKPLWDAKTEMQAVLGKMEISLQAYNERTGEKTREATGMRHTLHHKPHGVAAVFGPYNFPAHLPNGHIVPALLAGNTVVWKPSDYTPGVAEKIVSLWEQSGLPRGVLNLVQGGRETGIALAGAEIDALFFTGSVETGRALHKQLAGRTEIMLALELGGNNPLIVHEAEIASAVALTLQSAFITSGQRCTCARRLIVVEGREGDAFVQNLVEGAQALKIGAFTDTPEPFMGPLVSVREAKRLEEAQASLIALGAKVLRKGERKEAFFTPAILDVTGVGNVPDQEYFGPLLQVYRVGSFDEAIVRANDTRYGLAAGLLSNNAKLYAQFRAEIRAGVIAWNRPTTGASSALPFGGAGISGNHRPSAYYAADYCAWPVAATESEALAMPQPLPGMG